MFLKYYYHNIPINAICKCVQGLCESSMALAALPPWGLIYKQPVFYSFDTPMTDSIGMK